MSDSLTTSQLLLEYKFKFSLFDEKSTGFWFSSKDVQSVFFHRSVDFSDYALEFFGIYAIPSSVSFVGFISTWGEVIYAPLIGVHITPTVNVWNLTCVYQRM